MTLPVYRLNGTVSRRAGTTDNWNFWFAGKTENKVVSFHVDEKIIMLPIWKREHMI